MEYISISILFAILGYVLRSSILKLITTLLFTLIIIGCATTENKTPSWIVSPPQSGSAAVASASYEIFGVERARQNAIDNAVVTLGLNKGHATVESDATIKSKTHSQFSANGENVSGHSSVVRESVVNMGDVKIGEVKVTQMWVDRVTKRVWVLIEEQ